MEVIVVVVVVLKVLVRAAAVIDIVVVVEVPVNGVWADVEIIVVCLIVTVLKFALPVSYSTVDVASDVAAMDALASIMLGVVTGIGISVLAGVNRNAFANVTALEFPVSTPLEEFTR